MNSEKKYKGQLSVKGRSSLLSVLLVLLMASSPLLLSVNSGVESRASNEPPVANAGDDVTNVLLNDPVLLDGTNSTDEDIENCTWSWACISHDEVQINNHDTPRATFSVFTEEIITFQLTVTDPYNETDTDEIDIIPEINQDPEIDPLDVLPVDSGQGGPFYEIGTPLEFNASLARDPEGRDLEFSWESDVEGEGQFPEESAFFRKMNKLGWHNITLNITDPNGGSTRIIKNIKIREDMSRPAAAMVVRPFKSSYDKGETITLDGSSTTDENSFDTIHTMNFTWSTNSSGGRVLGYGPILDVELEEGRHNISLVVTDLDDLTSSDNQDVIVLNQPPIARITTPEMEYRNGERTVNVTDEAFFSGYTSFDPNGDELLFKWDFGDANTGTGMNVTHAWSDHGIYNVTLVVDDGSENDFNDTTAIRIVVNSIPTAVIEVPGEILTGIPVTFSANGSSDEDGDELTYRWDLDGDGIMDQSGFTTTFTYKEESDIIVTLRVEDGFAWAKTSIEISPRFPNEAPVPRVHGYEEGGDPILVELRDNSGEITLDATASYDPDDDINNNKVIDGGEKNNLTYEWDLNADKDENGDGIKDNDFTKKGKTVRVDVEGSGIWRVVLKATDKRGLSSTLLIEIRGNNPPEVVSLKSNFGSRIYADSLIRFTSTADDYDRGDLNKLQYHWDFGDGSGESVINGTGSTQSYTYTEPGTYQVISSVTDGYSWGTYKMTVTVEKFDGLTIRYPRDGAVLSGIVIIKGDVKHNINYAIRNVEISIDGGEWEKADNPPGWEYELVTWEYLDGEHVINVMVEMEGGVTQEESLTVIFKNRVEKDNSGVITTIVALIIVLAIIAFVMYLIFGKKSTRARDLMSTLPPPPGMGPQAPGMGVGSVMTPPDRTPSTPPAPPEEKQEEKKKTIRVKCPACKKIFKVNDTGERPLQMRCTHCGVKGTIAHVPGDEEDTEEESPDEDVERPEPVSIICPSCSGMFELTEVTDTARCPQCNISGELDDETIHELRERFDERNEDVQVRCPSCQSKFRIKSTENDIICPFCGASGSVPKK